MPKVAQGRNFNSLCHVRRVGLYNTKVSEEIVTTSGLRIRLSQKGLERVQKKYNGKALRLEFRDETKWCDVALKCVCCPCKCCSITCCPETTFYDLLVPGEAFIDGENVKASCGIKGSTCCLRAVPLAWCCMDTCTSSCENHIRIHHSEYELVDFEGDFIAPNNVNIERSVVKAPASPTNRNRGEDKKEFPGPNQTIPAPEKLEPITLQIEN
jgi:hypothetical protein